MSRESSRAATDGNTVDRKDDGGTLSTAAGGDSSKKVDPFFLASMTFAHGVVRDCECDECGLEQVPQSIKEAVRKHKRAKLMSVVEITHQERHLVDRDGGLSIWRLVLPVRSEPMVEYGNSHRIVLVKHMAEGVEVKSIGTGIVGSAAEEKARKSVGWRAGGGYVIPSNGGKAVGWVVCTSKDDSLNEESSAVTESASVEVVIIKATPEAMAKDGGDESVKSWTKTIRKIFNDEIPSGDAEDSNADSNIQTKELSATSIETLQQHVEQLMESK
jgi:hypothetical protein